MHLKESTEKNTRPNEKTTIYGELDIKMSYVSDLKKQEYKILLNKKDCNGHITSSLWIENAYRKGFWEVTLLEIQVLDGLMKRKQAVGRF
jgi:hypothetical protein